MPVQRPLWRGLRHPRRLAPRALGRMAFSHGEGFGGVGVCLGLRGGRFGLDVAEWLRGGGARSKSTEPQGIGLVVFQLLQGLAYLVGWLIEVEKCTR